MLRPPVLFFQATSGNTQTHSEILTRFQTYPADALAPFVQTQQRKERQPRRPKQVRAKRKLYKPQQSPEINLSKRNRDDDEVREKKVVADSWAPGRRAISRCAQKIVEHCTRARTLDFVEACELHDLYAFFSNPSFLEVHSNLMSSSWQEEAAPPMSKKRSAAFQENAMMLLSLEERIGHERKAFDERQEAEIGKLERRSEEVERLCADLEKEGGGEGEGTTSTRVRRSDLRRLKDAVREKERIRSLEQGIKRNVEEFEKKSKAYVGLRNEACAGRRNGAAMQLMGGMGNGRCAMMTRQRQPKHRESAAGERKRKVARTLLLGDSDRGLQEGEEEEEEGEPTAETKEARGVRRGEGLGKGGGGKGGGIIAAAAVSSSASASWPAEEKEALTEFLADVGAMPPQIHFQRTDVCPKCSTDMRVVPCKAVLCCVTCGYTATYLDATTSSISYGEDQVEFTNFSYKRSNHFQDHIQNFQGKETMRISDPILQKVMTELHRQRVTNVHDITAQRVRDTLKRLKLKNYEHVAQILSRITGRPAPRMSAEVEEMCRLMFKATQPAFEAAKPPERSNYLSYQYTLYKILQLLGQNHMLKHFSLLKGRDKLVRQDQMWREICTYNDWEFISTL